MSILQSQETGGYTIYISESCGFSGRQQKINTIYFQLSPLEDKNKLSTKYHHPGKGGFLQTIIYMVLPGSIEHAQENIATLK